jgi:hypothetical protein
VQGDSTPPVAAISPTRLKELAALLHTLASNENPGATVTTMQAEPFKAVNNGKVGLGTAACSRCFHPAACCRLE